MREEDLEVAIKVVIVGNGAVGKSSMIQRFCKGTFTRDYKKTIGVDFLERQIEASPGEPVRLMLWDTAGQEEFDALTKAYYRGAHACLLAFSGTDRLSFLAVPAWRRKMKQQTKETSGVTTFVKRHIDDSVVSVWCLMINQGMLRHIEHCTETEAQWKLKNNEGLFTYIKRTQCDIEVEEECGNIPMALVQNKIDMVDQCVVLDDEARRLAHVLGCPLFRTSVREGIGVSAPFTFLAQRCATSMKTDNYFQEDRGGVAGDDDCKIRAPIWNVGVPKGRLSPCGRSSVMHGTVILRKGHGATSRRSSSGLSRKLGGVLDGACQLL